MNLAEWGNHVVGVPEALILAALLAVLIAWARWQSRRRFARIQQEFLEQCSRPAILYLYVEDAQQNEGKVLCRKGAASPLFDAKNAPEYGVPKGVACYLAPGEVELDLEADWTQDLYLGRRHHCMRTQIAFRAQAGCGYAVVMNEKDQTSRLMPLHKA